METSNVPWERVIGQLVPIICSVSFFTFLTIWFWAIARRREREAFYRSEMLKKLADSSGDAAQQALQLLRDDDARRQRRKREGVILAGLILVAMGVALMIVIPLTDDPRKELGSWAVGLIPLLIGVAMLLHAKLVASRPKPADAS
jgi:hypothetical protein